MTLFFKFILSYIVLNVRSHRISSLERNDAPVLTLAVYLFIQEPKSFMFLSFFFAKKKWDCSKAVSQPADWLAAFFDFLR